MKSDVPLDYAIFQLSPRRSRCELFISHNGASEKLASGLVKPFVTHLKLAEEQFASRVKSIKLEVERHKKPEVWFTKGTLERFVRFVSTPEVLELVNTFDTEMSQLEAARTIYSQGPSDGSGGDGGATTASEATKKELLKAIDVRLVAVGQDLSKACTRASAAGFNPESVSELQLFADQFGAYRLSEACSTFLSLLQRRPELCNIRRPRVDDHALRSSSGSDMSVDDMVNDTHPGSVLKQQHQPCQPEQTDESRTATLQAVYKPSLAVPLRRSSSRESSIEKEDVKESYDKNKDKKEDTSLATADSRPPFTLAGRPARQLSVKERINLFENKQKETTTSGSGSKPAAEKSPELCRQPSDASSVDQFGSEKAVFRRWSSASDMSIDLSGERKDADSCSSTLTSVVAPTTPGTPFVLEDIDREGSSDSVPFVKPENKEINASQSITSGLKNGADSKKGEAQSRLVRINSGAQLAVSSGASEEGQPKLTSFAFPPKMEQLSTRCETYEGTIQQEDLGPRNQFIPKSHVRTFQRAEVDLASHSASSPISSKPNFPESIESEVEQVTVLPNSGLEKEYQVARKDCESDEKQHDTSSANLEGSGTRNMKFQRHVSASVHTKKSRSRRDDKESNSTLTGAAGKIVANSQLPCLSMSPALMEQAQRVRQSKGNQGLNNELKLKADELEKLFAEHQSSATRRSKPVEMQEKEANSTSMDSSLELLSYSGTPNKFNASPAIQQYQTQNYDGTPKQNTDNLGFSDESKGKLYHKYMQKRDAKLKEEWSLKRDEKEARMKAMHDSFERSKSEMKTNLAGSASRLDNHRRAEKLRSFSARSAIRREQPIHSFLSDENEDHAQHDKDSLTGETSLVDTSSRSTQNKRSSSRTSAIPVVSRSSAKAPASGGARRKLQPENPLAQSVPSLSGFKKENAKPSTASSSKGARHQKVGNYSHSKSTSEELPSFQEEKPRRPQHVRKSSANPLEINEFSFLNFDAVEHDDNYLRSMESFENEDEELINTANGDAAGLGCQFQQETSDFEASVYSPIGSPAYWNQSDSDAAARMRKTWGAAQKPNVASDYSHSQSQRKDVAKGLKRFLNFGRKNHKGADSLADWASVTTSDGDDDTEDGRGYSANRSSDDLRKSRMGFSNYHPSDDGFSETDSFSEQDILKKPFFSFSTFRSKGSDSKPR